LGKVPLDGGDPVKLTDKASYAPVLSPDGKLIACNYRPQAGAPIQIAVISIDGGLPIKTFPIPGANDRAIRWTPDGRSLAYTVTKDGVSNIWIQPLAGGSPKQLTEFTSHQIYDFAWSRDGRYLALSRSVVVSEVAMISDVK
jgi:Tol biopolymer transport system component